MIDMIIKKLGKLDIIVSRMEAMEKDLREVKSGVEFVHVEVQDLKELENKISKKTEEEIKKTGETGTDELCFKQLRHLPSGKVNVR